MRNLGLILFGSFFCMTSYGQEKSKGPIISDFGAVYEIENPSFPTKTNQTFKVVFDVVYSPEGHGLFNKSMETTARFLNMHAQQGVNPKKMQVAMVVHGGATQDLLNNSYFEDNFSTINQNIGMLKALMNAGVEIIVCGQSLASRGYHAEQLIPGVKVSLSAMTALIQLQASDYQLIKF